MSSTSFSFTPHVFLLLFVLAASIPQSVAVYIKSGLGKIEHISLLEPSPYFKHCSNICHRMLLGNEIAAGSHHVCYMDALILMGRQIVQNGRPGYRGCDG
ncbi:hypothetical protein AX15_004879 [Amanita polypyramis BW_CC]|nr:hypothetical protein AX15_004879 [Amanita polypyramis BW_CC]